MNIFTRVTAVLVAFFSLNVSAVIGGLVGSGTGSSSAMYDYASRFSPLFRQGGLVGSGVGVVEMNFQYAYVNLSTWIGACQASGFCSVDGRQGELFASIQNVILVNRARLDKLIFKSETQNPELFKTGIQEIHRLAVTGLTPKASIYVNLDLLYSVLGQPELRLPAIAGVLVHEIGHQTGEQDHVLLNEMAAQIRFYLERSTTDFHFETGSRNEAVHVALIQQQNPFRISQLNFSWGNRYSIDLSSKLSRFAQCQKAEAQISGYELYNGYFMSSLFDDVAEFAIWLRVFCYDEKSNSFSKEQQFLNFQFNANGVVQITAKP